MPNVVVDASTVVSAALIRNSPPEQAIRLARAVDVICVSDAVTDEIGAVLARPKFRAAITEARRREILEILMAGSRRYAPQLRVNDCRDPKDNKYLELALASGAAFLITGDADLLSLDPWRGVRICGAAEYIAINSGRVRPA
jgi:putative PIN family toxin of toxin-antitoxin system